MAAPLHPCHACKLLEPLGELNYAPKVINMARRLTQHPNALHVPIIRHGQARKFGLAALIVKSTTLNVDIPLVVS